MRNRRITTGTLLLLFILALGFIALTLQGDPCDSAPDRQQCLTDFPDR